MPVSSEPIFPNMFIVDVGTYLSDFVTHVDNNVLCSSGTAPGAEEIIESLISCYIVTSVKDSHLENYLDYLYSMLIAELPDIPRSIAHDLVRCVRFISEVLNETFQSLGCFNYDTFPYILNSIHGQCLILKKTDDENKRKPKNSNIRSIAGLSQ